MYKRTIWKDHVEGVQEGTSMNAEKFNKIEAGTMEANALAAFNAEFRRYDHDIAKDNEVVTVDMSEEYITDYVDVVIPANATRNNTNYRVSTEFVGIAEGTAVAVMISSKQANGFSVYVKGASSNGAAMKFHISGGMI